jgi:hypothetical protein
MALSGGRLFSSVSLLQDPDVVAEGIPHAHVGAIEVLGGYPG